MSLIKKTDVKNHLSARHRTEIHLQPAIQADATGFAHEESAGADVGENNSSENSASSSTAPERKPAEIVSPRSLQG